MSTQTFSKAFNRNLKIHFLIPFKNQPTKKVGCTRCCAPRGAARRDPAGQPTHWPVTRGLRQPLRLGPAGQRPGGRGGAPPVGAHRRRALPVARVVSACMPRRAAPAGMVEVARRRDEPPGRGSALAGEEGGGRAWSLPRRRRPQASASEAGMLGGASGGGNRGMEAWEGVCRRRGSGGVSGELVARAGAAGAASERERGEE